MQNNLEWEPLKCNRIIFFKIVNYEVAESTSMSTWTGYTLEPGKTTTTNMNSSQDVSLFVKMLMTSKNSMDITDYPQDASLP